MYAIFGEAFPFENPKLARVMYAGSDPGPAVEDILKTYLHSEYNRFMIAYDMTQGLVPDPGCEMEGVDEDEGMSKAIFGVISSYSKVLLESRDTLEEQVSHFATLSTLQTRLLT